MASPLRFELRWDLDGNLLDATLERPKPRDVQKASLAPIFVDALTEIRDASYRASPESARLAAREISSRVLEHLEGDDE